MTELSVALKFWQSPVVPLEVLLVIAEAALRLRRVILRSGFRALDDDWHFMQSRTEQ